MLPQELKTIFEECDDDEYYFFITKVEYATDNLILGFYMHLRGYGGREAGTQRWEIEAIGHKKNHISFDYSEYISIKKEHPLLWEFVDTQCELYYVGYCDNAPKLFCDLYAIHKEIFGEHQCFNISLYNEKTYPKLSTYSNGLLTTGPKKLLEKYADCLRKNGLDYNIIGERPGKFWNQQQSIVGREDLKALFIGSTFTIAEDFIFKRLD